MRVSLLLLLTGCALLDALEPPQGRNCDQRETYYPDADGDGLGERTAVYIGCEPPPGWVDALEPEVDTGDTAG